MWPAKFDPGSALHMMKALEDTSERWLRALKCRNVVPKFTIVSDWNPMNKDTLSFFPEAVLFLCNYASPSLIKADISTSTFKMLGHLLGSKFGTHALGVLICPVYSYKQHQLFMEEHVLLKQLSNASCSVDTMFQLNFDMKSKTDSHMHLMNPIFCAGARYFK